MAVSTRAVYRFVRTAGRELCEVSKKMRWDWTLKASGWGGLVGWGCGMGGKGELTEDFAGEILAGGAGEVDG